MNINQDLCANALRKSALLITEASRLGMNISGYGEIGENQTSGNVYLWLEEYPFGLYIGLDSDDIQACWTSFYNGDEEIIDVANQSLSDLYQWVEYNEAVAVD